MVWFAGGGLLLVALVAYHNSLGGPFVFDDQPAILENPSIRRLWPLGPVLAPELDGGVTVSGRPLVNLSLAFNYAIGGEAVAGYHAFNLVVHCLAGLVLFGVVRRTFRQPALAVRFGAVALPLAWTAAALWLAHPLQTAAVTYIVQRAEAMAGLCYLLTLYAFIRGADAARPGPWLTASVIACFAGMACKEVVVTAPLVVLLYDRTFVAGRFRAAWARRGGFYLALAGAWLLLGWLVAGTGGRGGTAGFGAAVGPWSYLLTQCQAIVHYLRLVLWPDPLVFDYGTATVDRLGEVWLQALLLVALAGATLIALVRRPVWGFAGAWFLLILAPSSSIVPVASQTMAEHRMYLPLAVLVVLAVAGLHARLGRRSYVVCGAALALLLVLTVRRNADYRSDLGLWTDTVAKRPASSRAHNNLGKAVFAVGRPVEAVTHYAEAIRLRPSVPEPYYNLGLALAKLGRSTEAIAKYEEALRLQPAYPEVHNNLGNLLLAAGRVDEAGAHYTQAVQLKPAFAEAHSNLANVRLQQGRGNEALEHGETAVQLDPRSAEARYNLGNAYAAARQLPSALSCYEEALRLKPDYADVANNRGNVLVELGRLPEAVAAYERAVQLDPDYADPRRNLTVLLTQQGRIPEAISHLQTYVRLRPGDQAAREELVRLRAGFRP